ncbi:MAG: hypothetical protein CMP96_00680, partial [Gammaproteobacteria bacterium]|nr:hypothetical protein [Gammaproteobacteria bacterium]
IDICWYRPRVLLTLFTPVSHWDSASRWVLVIARFQAKTCAAVPPRIDQRSPLDAASSQEPPVSADDQPEDI